MGESVMLHIDVIKIPEDVQMAAGHLQPCIIVQMDIVRKIVQQV